MAKPPVRPVLTILTTHLPLPDIAQALRLTQEEAEDKFRDARITSWFAEIWGERMFAYTKHLSSNHPGSDGALALGHLGTLAISVRCLTHRPIKFQKSKSIGSGRSASKADVIEALEEVSHVVVVDIRAFPLLRFIPLDTRHLARLARSDEPGALGPSGLTPAKFESWLAKTFAIREQAFDLPAPSSATDAGIMPG